MRKAVCALLMATFLFCWLPQTATADVLTDHIPEIAATGYVVLDGDTGSVLLGKDYEKTMDPANLVQIMTAVLVIDQGKLEDAVVVPEIPSDINNGNKVYLRQGEKVKLEKLLEAIIVYNANDAALAAAHHLGGSEAGFVERMNAKAKELGMNNTNFKSAYGSSDGQTTTALDMAKLTNYASSKPKYVELALQATMDWNSDAWNKTGIANASGLTKVMPQAVSIKMADNKSDTYHLAASLTEGGRTIVSVILGESNATTMYNDVNTVLTFGKQNTKVETLVEKDANVATVSLAKNKNVRVAAKEAYAVTKSVDDTSDVSANTVLDNIALPVKAGDQVGTIKITRDDQIVHEIPLTAMDSASKPIDWVKLLAILLAILYVLSMLYRVVHRSMRRMSGKGGFKPPQLPAAKKPMERPAAPTGKPQARRVPPPSGRSSLQERVQNNRRQAPPSNNKRRPGGRP